MAQNTFGVDVHVQGTLSASRMAMPSGTVTNDAVIAAAGIAATKLEHQFPLEYVQDGGTAVIAATKLLHIVQGTTCRVAKVQAVTTLVATGADRTVNVDVQRSTAGGAFATIMSATALLNNASTVRVAVSGTISLPNLVVGDLLQAVVTVAGAAGNQAQGLLVTVFLREDAQ